MIRLQFQQHQRVALLKLFLTFIFFTTCVTIPFFKSLPFITWSIKKYGYSRIYIDIYDCYFDGIASRTDPIKFYFYTGEFFGLYPLLESFNKILLYLLFFIGWLEIIFCSCVFILNILLFYQNLQNKKSKAFSISRLISNFSISLVIIEWILYLVFIIDFNHQTRLADRSFPEVSYILIDPKVNLILLLLMVIGILSLFISNYADFDSWNSLPKNNN